MTKRRGFGKRKGDKKGGDMGQTPKEKMSTSMGGSSSEGKSNHLLSKEMEKIVSKGVAKRGKDSSEKRP